MKMKKNNLTKLINTICVPLLGLIFFCNNAFAQDKVVIFAAASLTNALTDIAQQYEKQHNVNLVFSFASSSTLARQIAQGAPASIFLSANQKWMDYLIEQKAVNPDSKITLLKNTLVLIAPKNSPLVHVPLNPDWNIKASLDGSRLAVGDPDHVPAGRYAKQSLENLGLWQRAEPLLARANSVRGALALVERGEANLGIVYSTDAKIAANVKVLDIFPASSHKPIEYPMVMVSPSPNAATIAFYHYLQSSQAQSTFKDYGFGIE